MTLVIDIGCARYGNDYSIERLIEEFKPDVVWAFDPHPSTPDAFDGEAEDATTVHLRGEAAWTYDGEIGFFSDGLNSKVDFNGQYAWPKIPCFDLAKFIRAQHTPDQQIILKIDAEGSEYELLEHLIQTKTDDLLELAWVEWHCLRCFRGAGGHRTDCDDYEAGQKRRAWIERNLSCELKEWGW
jgi:FkbM family methyltransferase